MITNINNFLFSFIKKNQGKVKCITQLSNCLAENCFIKLVLAKDSVCLRRQARALAQWGLVLPRVGDHRVPDTRMEIACPGLPHTAGQVEGAAQGPSVR